MDLRTQMIGSVAMIFYGLITALSTILIHATTQKVSPILLAFNTFIFCLLIYSLLSYKTFKKISLIRIHAYPIFMLNLTTAICWIFTFISLKFIPAELFLFTYLCAMPILATIFFHHKIFKSLTLFIGLILLIYTYHDVKLIIGVLLAFMGGISGTIYSIYTKRITEIFTAIEILSLRFYLTVILTCILCVVLGQWQVLPVANYGQFAALSAISVIIPLILFQIGLSNLNLVKALSYMPLAPLTCYMMDFALGYLKFNVMQLGVIGLICLVLFL